MGSRSLTPMAVLLVLCMQYSSSMGTTTTASGTTTMAGTTMAATTTAAPTTTTAAQTAPGSATFSSYGITVTLNGFSATDFTSTVSDFKTSLVQAVNTYCNENETTAQACCNDQKTYSVSTASMKYYIIMEYVTISSDSPMTVDSDTVKVTFVLAYNASNELCASGTMSSRRKRSVTGAYLSQDRLLALFTMVQTDFATKYSTAASSTLGESRTITVGAVASSSSGNAAMGISASGWIITMAVVVTSLFVFSSKWTPTHQSD